ncbi:MAG: hypothetical protein HY340_01160 [Candidatus Kerfeldbacteria bacterium]|nr:hypothetical protein [Candidatus Kerfeldbacteria bacterium]
MERRFFVILLFLGVLALFFGVFQTLNAIRGPFRLAKQTTNEQQLGPTGAAISSLSKKDTDDDGLSDFDELYRYQTSPYLADSDSDGDNDQQEVFGGTDPNCATGSVCSPIAAVSQNANLNTAIPSTTNVSSNSNAAATTPEGFSLADLRITLRNAGAPAATLEGLSDDELLQLYAEVTGTTATVTPNGNTNAVATNTVPTGTNGNTNLSTNASLPETIDQSTLRNLTPAQIREFLRRGGADEAVLQEVDDATLRDIFQQALTEIPVTP